MNKNGKYEKIWINMNNMKKHMKRTSWKQNEQNLKQDDEGIYGNTKGILNVGFGLKTWIIGGAFWQTPVDGIILLKETGL